MSALNLSYEDIVKKSEKVAESLSGSNLDTQLRKFYDYLQKFRRSKKYNEMPLIRAKMAYIVARQEKLLPLKNEIEPLLKEAKDEADLLKLIKFVECVISFYKLNQVRRG